jgi:MOSC domain-containing protein YiiM
MGTVYQINLKGELEGEHGLPKRAVESAAITPSGLVGDFNHYRHRTMRDDPDSAVMLLPVETLRSLQAEGWPIRPGDLGENITSSGVEYGEFQPGRTFRVGEAAIVVTRPCDPCTNLYLLPYVGLAKGPGFLRTMLGRRGWYARVLTPGRIARGDPIELATPSPRM